MIWFPATALALSVFITLLVGAAMIFALYATMIGQMMGAPFVPSKKGKADLMIVLAHIASEDVVVDVGSGDGALVIAAARAGARAARGIEMNPFLVWYSRLRIRRAGLSGQARIMRANFYRVPLHDADVVLLYLWPSTMAKLREKLEQELKPGTRVVSQAFPIAGWTPIRTDGDIFLYRVGRGSTNESL